MTKTYKGVGGIDLPNDQFPAKITKGYYRVLEENSGNAAELGAYRLLANAIKTCDENPGSCVVADAGVRIYPQDDEAQEPGTTDEPTHPHEPVDDPREEPGGDDPGSDVPGDTPGSGDEPAEPKPDTPVIPEEPSEDEPMEVVGYAKLKTLMNVRMEPNSDGELVRTLKEDSIVAVTRFCENGWLRILCEEAEGGGAYLSNEGGKYATVGKTLYVVKKDDNLWKIAEEQLGDGSRYKEISEINFLVSNRIKVGMSLILPEVIPTAEEA